MPIKQFRYLTLVSALIASAAGAQNATFELDAATAEKIIAGCRAHAVAKKQSHAIAVYDKGGNLVAALRMDGNGPGVMAFSEDKARAVAKWGFATSGMESAIKETPGFADAPFVVTVSGGVPAFTADGKTFLGGVGVSGEAPADDAACAQAGIAAAGLLFERKR